MKPTQLTSILTSGGALVGIIYGVSKQKAFWATAGFALLFSIAGAAAGSVIQSIKNK
jgi:hypothetical protein